MKLINYLFVVFMLSIGLFVSCLKKDTTFYDATQSPSVISFGNTGTPIYNLYPYYFADLGVVNAGDTSGFNINIIYGGPSSAPQDITVNLALDTTALRLYNTAQSTNYVLAPTDVYKFPSSITIKGGTRTGAGRAIVTTATDFDYSAAYALPLKISSASSGTTISGNLSPVIYQYAVRNKYDGVYNLTGYHNRSPYNYRYVNVPMQMRTVGATAIAFYFTANSSYGHPIGVGPNNTLSWYGSSISPVIVIDPTTNKISKAYNIGGSTPISLYTGTGALANMRDPATGNIYVSWMYNNNPARAFFDTLTYVGPR